MKWPLLLTLLSAAALRAQSPIWRESAVEVPEPAREFRAAWAATVYNLDWPSRPGLPAEQQQKELGALLDAAQRLNLNAVLLQVRPGGDALYASAIEPWSAVLTGKMGENPGYDPLAFAVAEAHRRGLELHAWFNPFRARVGKADAPQHWTLQHPDWVRAGSSTHPFMDPGLPEVRRHVLAVMQDVLTRYDVDGLHLDDYFYPYPVFGPGAVRQEVPLGDEAQWAAQGRGLPLSDWRRDNINKFVEALYRQTKALKPWVRVGLSPFGIWQPGVPAGIEARVNAYDHLYGDSRRWLQEGWCDYLAPQLYWPIEPAKQSFTALLEWWTAQSKGRPVWPGVAVDRIASSKEPQLPLSELTDQLAAVRRLAPVPGAVMWRVQFLREDRRGIGSLLRQECFSAPALPPSAPWLGPLLPGKPALQVASGTTGPTLTWTAGPGAPVRWWVVQRRSAGQWILEPPTFGTQPGLSLHGPADAVAVRSLSATGMAGPPACWSCTP